MNKNLKSALKPHFLDYFFIIRPLLLVPMWAYMIFGFFRFYSLNGLNDSILFWEYVPISMKIIPAMFLFSLVFGAIVIINQLADYETDKLHPNIWLIASDFFPKNYAVIETIILVLCSIIGSVLFNQYPVVIFITLALGILYSVKPTRFSGRPFLDFITNAALYGFLPFLMGWLTAGGSIDASFIRNCLPYTLLMAAGAVNSTIQDIEDDSKTGKITTSVKYGAKNALKLSSVVLISAIVLSILFGDFYCVVICCFALIFNINALFYESNENYLKTLHIPGPIVVLSAGLQYPFIFALMLLALFASKLYYPWRFNINYPQVGK